MLRELTGGTGPDQVVDAVGVEAERPKRGPAAEQAREQADTLDAARAQVAPESGERDGLWRPGDAPTQAAQWAVEAVAKAGTVGVVGVYPPELVSYPFGAAFNKNLTIRTGNCPRRRYVPELVRLTASGVVDPATVLTQVATVPEAVEAYRSFDRREEGWLKTALVTDAVTTSPPQI